MPISDVSALRAAVEAAGSSWRVRELPADEPGHGLGWEPAPEPLQAPALERGSRLLSAIRSKSQAARLAGGPGIASEFDWRARGVIGAVQDQEWCGSCVSFATTGLLGAQAGIELGQNGLHFSEADQHFCSSHGANCGGWNNATALGQVQSRGVVLDAVFPYMTAFDNPPQGDPNDPEHLWLAYCRDEGDRIHEAYKANTYTAHTGDDRKTYLSTVGPMVCGFTVYEDFDNYGGGVYRHTSGDVRGGHAVLVVGYSDADQAWICRNSWGLNFGGAAHPDGTGAGFFKMGYGECGIDGEAFYGLTGVTVPPARWLVPTLQVPAHAEINPVSRSADHLDIFVTDVSGAIYTAAWEPDFPDWWHGWWRLNGGAAAPGAPVHGVSRSTDKLDVFVVGTDNHTYTAAWEPDFPDWWHGWWVVNGGVAAPGAHITAVSRSADHLDIFVVGTDGGVYTAAWEPDFTDWWHGWWRIGDLVAPQGAPVHCVSRSTDKLDIFVTDVNGVVQTAAWEPGSNGWQGWWELNGGRAAPGAAVTAVSRSTDKLDIFVTGTDGGVYTAAWEPDFTDWWHGWWRIGDLVAPQGAPVHCVSRSTDKLDIFATDVNGAIQTAAWEPGSNGWQGWWSLNGGRAAPGAPVTAVSRSTDKLDVFVVGTDSCIYTAAWEPDFTDWWHGWWRMG
ncbi:papain like protease [Jatrophihabitans sp. GAS493]|uniref:C1 family peptidase n=1 Tax=Jatrophihabitans sp. GAS493 TaxID=1907575 RepID=UPI000BB6AEB6|nr:C1 family peptidase [Jatrophihabitans sp. GAS493]SOD73597.1 papain like protease [Jatrophihabitans sp. GAS493]